MGITTKSKDKLISQKDGRWFLTCSEKISWLLKGAKVRKIKVVWFDRKGNPNTSQFQQHGAIVDLLTFAITDSSEQNKTFAVV